MSADNTMVIDRRNGMYHVWMALGDKPWTPGGAYLKKFKNEGLAHTYAHRVCSEEVVEYGVCVLYPSLMPEPAKATLTPDSLRLMASWSSTLSDEYKTHLRDHAAAWEAALADSGKEKGIPATFKASTLRLIADYFDAPREKKVIMYPSRQMREEWAILLNQIADELDEA